ncbi:checkpoint kinase [Aspergillus indologenus CBS 114.80]|uniref:Checkpoint kinase n=1 Tax=Aspergillus indologenus CBS 114.80 TaxID=1450541 RepID=A0A2V5I2C6_9EURO|nr:checkpoint kinase [Aspergillus indologenus CBS 114.80]
MSLRFHFPSRYVWLVLSTCAGMCGWFLFGTPTPASSARSMTTRLKRYGWPCPVQATGSTAVVFRCHAPDRATYAIKRFRKPAPGISATAYTDSVQHEVRLVGQIPPHPRILEIVDFFAEDGRWYVVMPFVSNNSLYDHTLGDAARLLSADEVDCVFYQLVTGVAFLHQQRVAHLDLKLNNILVTEEGEVKIIDFGQARMVDSGSPRGGRVTGRLGTAPNVPWEAYHEQDYDPFAADAWAVGLIYCQAILPNAPWHLGDRGDVESQFAIFRPHDTPPTSPMDQGRVTATVGMILRHLPLHARPLISQLLDIDPANRATAIERAPSDLWFQNLRGRCFTPPTPRMALDAFGGR